MNLEEYIEALRACPDYQLREELGIGDNYVILLKDHYLELCNFLWGKKEFELNTNRSFENLGVFPEGVSESEIHAAAVNAMPFFVYDEAVSLRIRNNLITYWTTGSNFWGSEERNKHKLKQLKTYNVTIEMHPVNPIAFKPEDLRKFADAVIHIGEFILEKGVQACLPHAVGQKYAFPSFDHSRIVYHEPAVRHI